MDFILAKIYCLRLIRVATITTFLIMLGLGINMFCAQANDSEHYMFMHDLKHTGRSAYNVAHINKLKWSSITGSEIWSYL